ncbi:hypothetical protein AAE02nite_22740 [Adhaeribacter aerolatus]|uniref:DUF1015 domain-containing protein n=1 Tax=Adhaeribacter aerolatus TaxID=670289 RepID=A0A512AY41_9BACT|nr:DUF1015 domain-containing protein [Adhaeribacter aerolatus]GEO04610.1 hypothetical protein AAE02nite_22740 [Adhaeribacter aerolatus]
MAEIRPLKGWRYQAALEPDINELTSPLFDVVSEKQRQTLYRQPYNSIHLSVPAGPNPADRAAALLSEWKKNEVLQQDVLPAIYVYYQYFTLPGSHQEYCRKGFMCHIWAYDWAEKIMLRHENTLPGSVNDRLELLDKTKMQTSATHGLYTDPHCSLEKYLDESMQAPLYETEDYQGARDVLAVIQDLRVIREFMRVLADKQVLLADGHHRYESSLTYRQKMTSQNPNHTGREAYNYHFIYLTNTENEDLKILPTHRVLTGLPFTDEAFLQKLTTDFIIIPVEDAFALNEIIAGKKWAFGLYLGGRAFKIRLKPEKFPELDWNMPPVVKDLDLTVLHYFVFERIMGIRRNHQRNFSDLQYNRNFAQCLTLVDTSQARAAFITNEVTMNEVKQVCYSGAVMPPKSTFFYPKVITGFLFSSIEQHEFESEIDSCFQLAPPQRTAGSAGFNI